MEIFSMEIIGKYQNDDLDFLIALMDTKKRERLETIKKRELRLRFILSDALARTIISERTGIGLQRIIFDYNNYGKPYCPETNIHFNTSHSGDWVIFGIDNDPIGIDIELCRPKKIDVMQRFLSTNEKGCLELLPPNQKFEYIFELWTLKESYTKMLGKGFSFPFNTISIEKTLQGINLYIDGNQVDCNFKQYHHILNHKLSVCSLYHFFPEEIVNFNFETLIKKARMLG
jgi:4'-phosphopantetheinyl transferase